MAERDDTTGKRQFGRGRSIILYLSLAANLVIVGLLVGAVLMSGKAGDDRRPPRAGDTGLGPLIRALEPADRRALGLEMRRTLRDQRSTRAEANALMDEIGVAVRAEPFNRATLEALMNTQFEEVEFRLALAQRVFLARIEAMSPEERAAFAQRLEEEMAKPRRGPGRRDD